MLRNTSLLIMAVSGYVNAERRRKRRWSPNTRPVAMAPTVSLALTERAARRRTLPAGGPSGVPPNARELRHPAIAGARSVRKRRRATRELRRPAARRERLRVPRRDARESAAEPGDVPVHRGGFQPARRARERQRRR